MDPETLSAFLSSWGHAAFLLLLILTGVGSPVPENFVLIVAGDLVASGEFQWLPAFAAGLVGVVVSDLLLFSAGRHLAWRSEWWSDGHLLSCSRLERVTAWFDRSGDRLVFVARLVPGTRAMVGREQSKL